MYVCVTSKRKGEINRKESKNQMYLTFIIQTKKRKATTQNHIQVKSKNHKGTIVKPIT